MSHILPTDYVDSTYDIDFQKLRWFRTEPLQTRDRQNSFVR